MRDYVRDYGRDYGGDYVRDYVRDNDLTIITILKSAPIYDLGSLYNNNLEFS